MDTRPDPADHADPPPGADSAPSPPPHEAPPGAPDGPPAVQPRRRAAPGSRRRAGAHAPPVEAAPPAGSPESLSQVDLLRHRLERERVTRAELEVALAQRSMELLQAQMLVAQRDLATAAGNRATAHAGLRALDQEIQKAYDLKPYDRMDPATGALIRKPPPAAPAGGVPSGG